MVRNRLYALGKQEQVSNIICSAIIMIVLYLRMLKLYNSYFNRKGKNLGARELTVSCFFHRNLVTIFFFFLVWQSVYIHTQQIKHLMTSQELHFFLFLALSLTQDVLNIITNFFAKDYRKQNESPLKISNGVAQKMHFFPRLDCQFLMKIEG